MDQPAALSSSEQDDQNSHHHLLHSPLRPKHAHSLTHRNLKRKREVIEKRQSSGYAALDVVVVDQGTTVGDVLLGSIPSDPTTASLSGFGLVTLSSFIPATATDSSSSALTTPAAALAASTGSTATSSPSPTAAASVSSLTPAMTGSNSTSAPSISTNNTASSVAFNIGMATSLNATTSTTSLSTSFSSSDNLTSSSMVSTSFATTTSSPISSSAASTSNGGVIGAGAGSPTSSAVGSSPTTAVSSGSTTNTQAGPIAGGVVGGVAGAALLAALIFVLIRLYRKRQARGDRLIGGPGEEHSGPGTGASPPMTQRSSLAPLAAAVRRFRPDSTQTTSTATGPSGAASSERGFQKVGGRKLQSVLQSGGDGYTDPASQGAPQHPPVAYGAAYNRESDLSGMSFYRERDSGSHYGSTAGHNSQQYEIPGFETGAAAVRSRNMQTLPSDSSMAGQGPTSSRGSRTYNSPATGNPFADPSSSRADRALATFSSSPDSDTSGSLRSPTPGIDEALSYHQGPVRTPVITGGNNPPPPPAPRRPGHGADGVGRSNPSWDGSRHSRFSEAI